MSRMLYGRGQAFDAARGRAIASSAGSPANAVPLAPIMKAMHGTFDANDLFQELARRVPRDFDVLMVHCAFDDLVPMYRRGAPRVAAHAADSCAGPIAHWRCPPSATSYRAGISFATWRRTPFRGPPLAVADGAAVRDVPPDSGVVRSYHPTHSVCAIGPLAASLTSSTTSARSTFGAESPFAKMAGVDTIVLGLGKPFYRVLTQTHVPEDLLGDRFPVAREFRVVEVTMSNGKGEYPTVPDRSHEDRPAAGPVAEVASTRRPRRLAVSRCRPLLGSRGPD